jgi:acyl carrier protein
MSSDRLPSAVAAPTAFPADPVTDVVAVLGEVLLLKPDNIDPRQSFRFLGLDSLLAVEFVASVNARCGTRIKAAALSDHPTPLAFARHVNRELRTGPPTPAGPSPMGGTAPRSAHSGLPAPAAPAARGADREVLDVLREELARLLCCDPWDIDVHAPFDRLGVDSIIGGEFVAAVNRIYGTRERSATLYAHPNPAALAAHVALLAAQRPAPMDVEVLLDAVRDDLLTVDQALALLSRRG